MELPEFIYRLVNDEALRSLMQDDVNKAVAAVEADLSQEELEALAAISWETPSSLPTPQGPNQWWVRQLSHCLTPVRLSTPA